MLLKRVYNSNAVIVKHFNSKSVKIVKNSFEVVLWLLLTEFALNLLQPFGAVV